jgi:HEXXH motif-containing protein
MSTTAPTGDPRRAAAPPLLEGPLDDLTLPVGGTQTFRRVLNAYWRTLVRDLASVPVNFLTPHNRALYQRVQGLAQGLLKGDPRRFVAILREPTHAALLCTLKHHCHPRGDLAQLNLLARELCLLLLTEMAVHGLLPAEGVVAPAEGPWPALRSIHANFVVEPAPETAAVAFANGRLVLRVGARNVTLATRAPAETEREGGTVTRPYLPIVDGIHLAVSDNNPLSHFEAHPDKQGNQLDLGGRTADEWAQSLRASMALVDRYLPHVGQEMRLCLRTIVPVGWDEHKHLSASYREAVGTVYMTLHPQLMTMTEALIHEFQHNKLNALASLDPLLHNAFSPLYSSPVRPDPRPLHGVVLAVHAFQPVAKLYERMAADQHAAAENPYFFKRFRDIIRMDRAGARTVLDHAQPTPLGEGFFAEMRRLDDELGAYEAARWQEAAEGQAPDLPVDE